MNNTTDINSRVEVLVREIFKLSESNNLGDGLALSVKLNKALRVQDKITRHACAENVRGLLPDIETFLGDLVYQDNAHQVVMNTKEGLG